MQRRAGRALVLIVVFLAGDLAFFFGRSEAQSSAGMVPLSATGTGGGAGKVTGVGENIYCEKGNRARFGEKDGPAELPRTCYYTGLDGTPSPEKQVRVSAGSDLSATLERAQCGETLLLAAGSVFRVREFPAKSCDDLHYITVRTDASNSQLPPEGSRISPAWAGVASLPGRPPYAQPEEGPRKLLATIEVVPPTGITFGDHYRFIGIEWTPAPGAPVARLAFTGGADHIIFDRNWFHGVDGEEHGQGISLNQGGSYIAIIHSYFNDFICIAKTGACTDAHAIGGGNGESPIHTLKIVDNFLEGSGENILFGGAASTVIPEDIEIRGNHLFKPMFWNPNSSEHRGPVPIVKNLFELKSAQRLLFEGNYLENSWGGFTQAGGAIVITPAHTLRKARGDVACPNCAVTNITIRYCWIRQVNEVLQMVNHLDLDHPPAGNNYSIHDVVAEGLKYPACGQVCNGALNLLNGGPGGTPKEFVMHDVTVDHITYVSMAKAKAFLTLGGPPAGDPPGSQMENIFWTNTIGDAGLFGVWGVGGKFRHCADVRGAPDPRTRLQACWSGNSAFKGNVLAGGTQIKGRNTSWPENNYFPSDQEHIGYVKFNGGIDGDYHLDPSSKFKSKGSAGTDPGANLDELLEHIRGVR